MLTTKELIISECDKIKEMLLEKNLKYGDSAINPIRIFSKANTTEQLKVRLDDKLSRIKNGIDSDDEDVILDMIGYLILLRIGTINDKQTEISREISKAEEDIILEYMDINSKNKGKHDERKRETIEN